MLKFNQLLHFPTYYKDRNQKVREVVIRITGISNTDNITSVQAIANSRYTTQIEYNQTDKTVKCYCSCASFTYEFASILLKNHAVLNEQQIKYQLQHHPPRKTRNRRNPFKVISACKHVIRLCQVCRERRII